MTESFSGRRVVVTGAASGIGESLVRVFHQAGASVLGADIDADGLTRLAEQFPGVDTLVADISDGTDCDRIIDAAGERLDVLCNNAGILDRLALIDEISDELWDQVIAVNLSGTFRLARRGVLKMIAQGGGGVIINTASTAAHGGGRAGPAYTASKAGVIALTKSIAVTCAEHGIRCNAISPGGTETAMAHSLGTGELSERGMALLGRLTGKPAPAHPDQIARVALFLASDGADRVSGVELPVHAAVFAY